MGTHYAWLRTVPVVQGAGIVVVGGEVKHQLEKKGLYTLACIVTPKREHLLSLECGCSRTFGKDSNKCRVEAMLALAPWAKIVEKDEAIPYVEKARGVAKKVFKL